MIQKIENGCDCTYPSFKEYYYKVRPREHDQISEPKTVTPEILIISDNNTCYLEIPNHCDHIYLDKEKFTKINNGL